MAQTPPILFTQNKRLILINRANDLLREHPTLANILRTPTYNLNWNVDEGNIRRRIEAMETAISAAESEINKIKEKEKKQREEAKTKEAALELIRRARELRDLYSLSDAEKTNIVCARVSLSHALAQDNINDILEYTRALDEILASIDPAQRILRINRLASTP